MRVLFETPDWQVYEYAPCTRTISFYIAGKTNTLAIKFPWTVFFRNKARSHNGNHFNFFGCCFCTDPFVSLGLSQKVHLPIILMGNARDSGICLDHKERTRELPIKSLISMFWNTSFSPSSDIIGRIKTDSVNVYDLLEGSFLLGSESTASAVIEQRLGLNGLTAFKKHLNLK